MSDLHPLETAPAPAATPSSLDLATRLAAKLCHDFISPTSALVSGLDLLEDPNSQDMREDAMGLIAASGRKLEDLLTFYRIAFGGSNATELFDVRELEKLAHGRYAHARAELDWAVTPAGLDKVPARTLLNLAELGIAVLPVGGVARLEATEGPEGVDLTLRAEGNRAGFHADVERGLTGRDLGDGLGGRWVQPYFLHTVVREAGGGLSYSAGEGSCGVAISLPRSEPSTAP